MNTVILVACHTRTDVADNPLLKPIQVGTALSGVRFPGYAYDDSGQNISKKNRSYCELTAQYWAWKNCSADYYGMFHYRRYLYPAPRERKPYRIVRDFSLSTLEKLRFDRFPDLIPQCDLILPMAEDMHISVREHYSRARYHREEDLAIAEDILREKCPEYRDAAEAYLTGTVQYFGNIFIMKQSVFYDYCAWLFPILEEFDRRAEWAGRSDQELRADGYLAERLLGIYYTKHRDQLATQFLPRAIMVRNTGRRWLKQMEDIPLPPGSWFRSRIKRVKETIEKQLGLSGR